MRGISDIRGYDSGIEIIKNFQMLKKGFNIEKIFNIVKNKKLFINFKGQKPLTFFEASQIY